MSLSVVRSVFEMMENVQAWSICLLKIKNTQRAGTTYATRGISLEPTGALSEFVKKLGKIYTDGDDAALNKYSSVSEYDGTTEAVKIYKLHANNELVAEEYNRLIQASATPERAGDPFEFAANAYMLKATLSLSGVEKPVMLFSMQNPVCVLKNRFLYDAGTFREIKDKVLNLRPVVNALIVDKDIYLLTMDGEKLFNMERSYKAVCRATVMDICEADILSNENVFKDTAQSGHNPRRFVAFNKSRFEQLRETETRRNMARMFCLSLNDEGKIDTSSKDSAEKLIKLLCNKGMLDPFTNAPVEVPSASRW